MSRRLGGLALSRADACYTWTDALDRARGRGADEAVRAVDQTVRQVVGAVADGRSTRRGGRPTPRRRGWALAWRYLAAPACAALIVASPVVAQDAVPPAGPPVSLSGRLLAQGHPVTPAEAVYLDADEQVTEQYVRLLVVIQELAGMAPTAPGWRQAMTTYLQALADLDPTQAPVAPPDSLAPVHAQAVDHRAQLGASARAWLVGVQAGDSGWVARGAEAYGAAESARLAWQRALWEHYVGAPAPGP